MTNTTTLAVWRAAYRMTGYFRELRPDEQDDVAQDVALAALLQRDPIRNPASYGRTVAWKVRSSHARASRLHRARRRAAASWEVEL